MGNRIEFKRISDEEFERMVVAIANSAVVMIQGQKFDGRGQHSYEDINYYFSKIGFPNTNSRSYLIATRTAVDKEYFPDQINSSTLPINDRQQLKQITQGDFRRDVKSCLDEQSDISIRLTQRPDGIYTDMNCMRPDLPQQPLLPRPLNRQNSRGQTT